MYSIKAVYKMNPLIGWVTGILSVVLLGTLVDLILGEKKMGKYVKSIFAAVTILVIITPIPSLVQHGIDFNSTFILQNEFVLDENFLDFSNRTRLNALSLGVERQLETDGIVGAKVTISGNIEGIANINIELVRINLQNAVIETLPVHIHKYELVANLVAHYLSIERGRIIVYGSSS